MLSKKPNVDGADERINNWKIKSKVSTGTEHKNSDMMMPELQGLNGKS